MNTIGRNIRILRQSKSWSQSDVATRLSISVPAFSKIETGITDINISRLNQIANLFEVSTVSIIAREEGFKQSDQQEEINVLKDKLAFKEDEIITLQKRVIELYEELRKNAALKDFSHR
ncbi:hypothetical protein D9M68_655820 [compost metagenome]